MKFFVTGGAGFIGSAFVRMLLGSPTIAQQASLVVNFDKLTYAGNLENLAPVADDKRYRFVHGDICDAALVNQAITETHPDVIVNFAAESHVDRSILSPAPVFETNLRGTFTLLEAARTHKTPRFLHVSTDEVYGSIPAPHDADEDYPLRASSPYSASKAGSDLLALSYFVTYGMPVMVTRASNNYGPYQFPEKLIPLMILNALEGRPLPIYGDGGNIRDWLHVDDHCAGLLLVLAKGRVGEKYNVGGGNERTNLQVVDALCNVLDRLRPQSKSCQTLKTFVPDRPGHDRRYAIDAAKIRRELGWAPAHAFEDGLLETVRWYLDHRDWCEGIQKGRYNRERLGLS
jgi:dTDP-glucose 4,6-dehydratase